MFKKDFPFLMRICCDEVDLRQVIFTAIS